MNDREIMTDEVKEFFHKKAAQFNFKRVCECGDRCFRPNGMSATFISSDKSFILVDITTPTSDKPTRDVWYM